MQYTAKLGNGSDIVMGFFKSIVRDGHDKTKVTHFLLEVVVFVGIFFLLAQQVVHLRSSASLNVLHWWHCHPSSSSSDPASLLSVVFVSSSVMFSNIESDDVMSWAARFEDFDSTPPPPFTLRRFLTSANDEGESS